MIRAFFVKRLKRWDRRLSLSKRQEFVIITGILTTALMLTQLAPADWRYPMVVFMSVLTYGLCALALREDLKGAEWVTLLTLPTLFTAAVGLFYFLLPARWLTRVPIASLYAVGMYALLLTENIYNVAATRTIGLLRVGHSVGLLLSLATYFLLVQSVYAFRFFPFVNALIVAPITYLLTLQALWAMELDAKVGKSVRDITLMITVVCMELSWVFSLWPVHTTMQALFLTTCFYSLTGMGQQYLTDRLYKRTVWEFFGVVAIVFVIILLTTKWHGMV
jgi:hypothetical protein